MITISILGCGWLGLPLAKALLSKGFLVKGSTTSVDKLAALENAGIEPYLIALSENKATGNTTNFLENSEILIIDIPPKLRGSGTENFVSKIRNVIPFIEKSAVQNVLFISSTSVYNDVEAFVTEATIAKPDTEGGKQLLETEQLLQSNKNFKTTVLRFGGLIGEDRHPIKFLAGRENLDNPDAPVNLIHQDDCIGIILKIIETDSWNETINAVAPSHPTRELYYTQKGLELDLALPKFNHKNPSIGKTILSSKIETVLKYTFTKPNL
ncbi:Rossmann-fold NAD(P)-binding domain-containing protein [Flavobacterium glaciei]|uniref:Nucleoside-diphosphate-sugar epimerase n=1 Tax=Flavobacterium glaciei TaxID=386300 RepID=A0A562PYJ5_9FLAO|nr:SDR family NAD(P)-dependent oxidoreductase [Flavobacterium glaciei]RDI56586.1 nucleoside-diphosphate-sugar epimerase [Flavobacterium glaciei]TWI49156.1 nucleoside-diphosphate-sugar epimerase [Flavobacterium glaciei]